MTKHIMVDIETLSTKQEATIVSIRATAFDIHKSVDLVSFVDDNDQFTDNVFYTAVDVEGQKGVRHVCEDTIGWWQRQTPEARAVFKDPERLGLEEALVKFGEFCEESGAKIVWCNGATFDHPILSHAFDQFGMKYPFQYYNQFDMRTLKFICKKAGNVGSDMNGFVAHNAAWDCIKQTIYTVEMLNRVSVK